MKHFLKKALSDHRVTIGSWLQISHPLIPEIMASAGFDWLVVDMEHSSIELNDLLGMVISIEANHMVPLVRVGENDPNLIKRVMDIGAYGIIVANIQSRAEAEAAVNAVKYPPEGTRGVGLYRAQKFGREFDSYKRWLSDDSVVIIQIEHIDAVRQIDDILETPGIDAFIIGPYDLSASLGKPGEFEDPEVTAALNTVMAAARRHRIPAGFHSVSSQPAEAKKRIDEGYTFLAFGVDFMFLGDMVCDALEKLKGEIKLKP
jgi:2-dehydro-3-deoxyglucarate aldolase